MKILITVLILIFSFATHATDCDDALVSYKNAMSELVKSQLEVDQTRVDGRASDAALRFVKKLIERRKQELATALGADAFAAEFERILQLQSGIKVEDSLKRQKHRKDTLLKEAALGVWSQVYVFESSSDKYMRSGIFITPDGRYVVIHSRKNIQIFDFATGRHVRDLFTPGNHYYVSAVMVSPDGRFVAAALGKNIIISDIETGVQVARFKAGPDVNGLYFTPDGLYVISKTERDGYKNIINVWDISTGKHYLKFKPYGLEEVEVDISPDGRQLLVSTRNDKSKKSAVEIVDLEIKKKVFEIVNNESVVEARFLQDSNHIATKFSKENHYSIWTLDAAPTKSFFSRFKVNEPTLTSNFGLDLKTEKMLFTSDQKKLILGSANQIAVLDTSNYEQLFSIDSGYMHSRITISLDNQTLGFVSSEKEIQMWDLGSGRKATSVFTGASILSFLISPSGKNVITLDANKDITVWHHKPGSTEVE